MNINRGLSAEFISFILTIMSKSANFVFISVFIVSCVNGQPDTWLNVARDVSVDFVNFLANFPLPLLDNFATSPSAAPIISRPPTTAPTPRVTLINGQPFLVFDPVPSRLSVPPPSSSLPSIRDPWDAVEHPLLSLFRLLNGLNPQMPAPMHNVQSEIISLPSPSLSPSSSHSHHGPCHSECGCGSKGPLCKPERVRIVVVDDCNDTKKKSSESCSSESNSEEVDVVVPRTGRRTFHYSVKGKK